MGGHRYFVSIATLVFSVLVSIGLHFVGINGFFLVFAIGLGPLLSALHSKRKDD